ncbi:Linoleate 13S-lipoxygenase 2-1, chloroplastic [Linum grandiflorum]
MQSIMIQGSVCPGGLNRPAVLNHGRVGLSKNKLVVSGGKPGRVTGWRAGRSVMKVEAIFGLMNPMAMVTSRVKAVVTVEQTVGGFVANTLLVTNTVTDLLGTSLDLELLSADLDPKTGKEKSSVRSVGQFSGGYGLQNKYQASFAVPADFGPVGAIRVANLHTREMFIKDIVITGLPDGNTVNIECQSWVHPFISGKPKRVFFTTKSYLPSDTPSGLRKMRSDELVALRGSGQGERQKGDRIYDYDVYNDLGDPDKSDNLRRPVLGGKERPYPRRCRTGRPRSFKDPQSEMRPASTLIGNVGSKVLGFSSFYVPRDEEFSEIKQANFSVKRLFSLLHSLLPILETVFIDPALGFPHFTAINKMFDQGLNLPPVSSANLKAVIPTLIRNTAEASDDILQFEVPPTMERNSFFWFTDEEFARQTLAGLNPCTIQLIKEWPLKSNLDPAVYGPQESAITNEMIEKGIRGFTTLDEAIKQKKLFMLDYHDIFLPLVGKAREQVGTTLYGSRTIFFLSPSGSLIPIAIELTRPPLDGKPQWKRVYSPYYSNATDVWLWRLAKTHVLAHDSAYHQLISHWLRTHACTEPYIIAARRQLSAMHPIHRLLKPHFKYTMEINSLAREGLINAGGVIEENFSILKHTMVASSAVYDKVWRFDYEALPKDLINRGMAVEDPSAPHGLKLTIEDYPYANDGLLVWDSIKQWVTDYVNHYYADPKLIASDTELQEWWKEVRNQGHADKKDEPWWPNLNTPEDLVEVVTTIIWVASGHHAAVNFGQYAFGGYFPNQPTISRLKMPDEDPTPAEWDIFMMKPETVLLTTFPSQIQAAKVVLVLDVLSAHSPDEEYLGKNIEPAWADEPQIKAAFENFNGRMMEIEGEIDERNADVSRVNRSGAGIYPYELLKPFSEDGVTGKGVPCSISI